MAHIARLILKVKIMLPFYFGYYHSPIGLLRIKATDESIHELVFIAGKEDENDFHQPLILHECVKQLEEYFSGKRLSFELSLNPESTLFQRKVWDHLAEIPFGKTVSYLELARQLGDEKSIRAVANANGKNPIAIVVPCHRVIGSDQSLTGYAWGLQRKQWLLDHEAKVNGTYNKLF
jgi:methylated-DNA-[protein]-cysteine S-methyltransferase